MEITLRISFVLVNSRSPRVGIDSRRREANFSVLLGFVRILRLCGVARTRVEGQSTGFLTIWCLGLLCVTLGFGILSPFSLIFRYFPHFFESFFDSLVE